MAVIASGSFVRSEKAGQPSTSYSENITIPAGANRRLWLLFCGGRFTADTQSVPTFNGTAMTVVGDTAPGGGATSAAAVRVVGYEALDPAVGAGSFAVTNPANVNDGVWYYLVIDDSSGASSAVGIDAGPSPGITTATPAAGVESGEIGFVAGLSAAYSGGGVLSGTTQVGVLIAGHCAGHRTGANPGLGTWPQNQAAALTLVAPQAVPGGFLAGATLSRTNAAGSLSAIASAFVAGATLGDIVAGGTLGPQPGVITSQALRTNNGSLLASTALDYVDVYLEASGVFVGRFTGLSTNGLGVFTITSSLLTPGTAYKLDWRASGGQRRMPVATAA